MVGKPLNELIEKVQRVGKGDFSGPVQLKSTDELGSLGTALNEMCDQLSRATRKLDDGSCCPRRHARTTQALRSAQHGGTDGGRNRPRNRHTAERRFRSCGTDCRWPTFSKTQREKAP